MNEKEKLAMLAEVFDLEEGELTPETMLEDLEEYDSMAKLSLIVMMSDEFGVKLDGEAIRGFKKVADILEKMEK